MNHLRRRWSAVLVLLVASSVVACTDENVTVSADEPPMAEIPPNRWVDLPRSPVGDWDSFNWVFLADRSGFVHAGAATTDPDGTVTSTPAAAFFSFEERRFIRLPDLPVTSGVGRAGGARVGDTMVIVGQDCPPSPGFSGVGVEFCDAGGQGAKVVLTLRQGAPNWGEYTVPDWMEEFRQGTPDVLGVLDGKVIVASGHLPAHLGAFDPETGEWTRLPDLPKLASEDAPDLDPAVASFGATTAQPCLIGDDLVAVMLGEAPSAMSFPEGQPVPDRPAWWYRLDGDAFVEIPAPITGRIATASCMHAGLLVGRAIDSGVPGHTDLSWVDPVAGTAALLDDDAERGTLYAPITAFADAALMQPPVEVNPGGTPPGTYRVATAGGMVDTDLEVLDSYVPITVVGSYAIWQNDLNGVQRTSGAPRIAKLSVP